MLAFLVFFYYISMDPIIAALFTLVGAFGVAATQLFFGRRATMEGKLSDRTAAAYSDYLNAVARFAHLPQMGDYEIMDKAEHLLADAKCRIVVYGDLEVVHAMAVFARLGDILETKEQISAFVAITQAMRKSNRAKESIAVEDVLALLFNSPNKGERS